MICAKLLQGSIEKELVSAADSFIHFVLAESQLAEAI